MSGPDVVSSTENSLEILRVVKSTENPRLTDITSELGFSKSTVHNHLKTLEKHGYVSKEGETYRIGLKFFHFGQHFRNHNARYELARATTSELAEEFNHAVDFDVKMDGQTMVLFHETDESTEVGLNEGDCLPMHTSATGRAILAELPDSEVREVLNRRDPARGDRRQTPSTEQLFEAVERTRERGYAVINQEWLEGLRAVAIAVNRPNGRPLGALSVGGPTYRLTDDEIESNVIPRLRQSSEKLESEISAIPP